MTDDLHARLSPLVAQLHLANPDDVTTRLLERAGFEVLAVGDGAEAVAAAQRAERIDVLVTVRRRPAWTAGPTRGSPSGRRPGDLRAGR